MLNRIYRTSLSGVAGRKYVLLGRNMQGTSPHRRPVQGLVPSPYTSHPSRL